VGRRRSGKSTIGRTIRRLLGGERNVVSISIAGLASRFGLEPLLDKQLAIMWDATVNNRNVDTSRAVEVLKSISGEDGFNVDRKNKETLEMGKINVSILVIANKLLDLRDNTGALAGRFTFLETNKSFYGSEDPSIEEEIIREIPGIFNEVIRANENYVQEHPKSEILKQEFEESSSPYSAFINEMCDVDPDNLVPTDIAWAHYNQWAKDNKHGEMNRQRFKMEFAVAHDGIIRHRPRLTEAEIWQLETEYKLDQRVGPRIKINKRPHCFKGIDMKSECKGQWNTSVGLDRSE
jgi:putative DNA primase/helicase